LRRWCGGPQRKKPKPREVCRGWTFLFLIMMQGASRNMHGAQHRASQRSLGHQIKTFPAIRKVRTILRFQVHQIRAELPQDTPISRARPRHRGLVHSRTTRMCHNTSSIWWSHNHTSSSISLLLGSNPPLSLRLRSIIIRCTHRDTSRK